MSLLSKLGKFLLRFRQESREITCLEDLRPGDRIKMHYGSYNIISARVINNDPVGRSIYVSTKFDDRVFKYDSYNFKEFKVLNCINKADKSTKTPLPHRAKSC